MVSHTQTCIGGFESFGVAGSTGVIPSSSLQWFDANPGRPNSLEPGKRPVTNMTPMIVERDGRAVLAIGVGALTSYNYAADYQVVPVSLIGSAFSLAVFPSLSAAWNDGDRSAFRSILGRNVVTIGVLTLLAAVVMGLVAHPVIERVHGGGTELFGDEYDGLGHSDVLG